MVFLHVTNLIIGTSLGQGSRLYTGGLGICICLCRSRKPDGVRNTCEYSRKKDLAHVTLRNAVSPRALDQHWGEMGRSLRQRIHIFLFLFWCGAERGPWHGSPSLHSLGSQLCPGFLLPCHRTLGLTFCLQKKTVQDSSHCHWRDSPASSTRL